MEAFVMYSMNIQILSRNVLRKFEYFSGITSDPDYNKSGDIDSSILFTRRSDARASFNEKYSTVESFQGNNLSGIRVKEWYLEKIVFDSYVDYEGGYYETVSDRLISPLNRESRTFLREHFPWKDFDFMDMPLTEQVKDYMMYFVKLNDLGEYGDSLNFSWELDNNVLTFWFTFGYYTFKVLGYIDLTEIEKEEKPFLSFVNELRHSIEILQGYSVKEQFPELYNYATNNGSDEQSVMEIKYFQEELEELDLEYPERI